MPTVINSETPLPIPRSVICSPNHIKNRVAEVRIITVWMRYNQRYSAVTREPENPENAFSGFSQPRATINPWPKHSTTVR